MIGSVRGALDLLKREIEELQDDMGQVCALAAAAEIAEVGAYCMARAASGQAVARVILLAAELQQIADRCGQRAGDAEAAQNA